MTTHTSGALPAPAQVHLEHAVAALHGVVRVLRVELRQGAVPAHVQDADDLKQQRLERASMTREGWPVRAVRTSMAV